MAEMLVKLGNAGRIGAPNGMTKVQRYGRDVTFSDVLKARIEQEAGLKFSSHAMERLNERGINLNGEELSKLSTAVSKAEGKGVQDSLILINDKAFIVSIKNRTVVTAMTGDALKENVFTNIDSAVVL